MSALREQVGSEAYTTGWPEWPIQPVEFVHANKLDYIQGAIIKYICRFRFKNGKEDLMKARHYIDLLTDLEYGSEKEKAEAAKPEGPKPWQHVVPPENSSDFWTM